MDSFFCWLASPVWHIDAVREEEFIPWPYGLRVFAFLPRATMAYAFDSVLVFFVSPPETGSRWRRRAVAIFS